MGVGKPHGNLKMVMCILETRAGQDQCSKSGGLSESEKGMSIIFMIFFLYSGTGITCKYTPRYCKIVVGLLAFRERKASISSQTPIC